MVPTKDMDRNVFKFAELVSVHLLHREKKNIKGEEDHNACFHPVKGVGFSNLGRRKVTTTFPSPLVASF